MTQPLETGLVPKMVSFAVVSSQNKTAILEGTSAYLRLPEGVSTITVTVQNSGGIANLHTEQSWNAFYRSVPLDSGRSAVLSNVAVARNQRRYLRVVTDTPGVDVGVTIITWPT